MSDSSPKSKDVFESGKSHDGEQGDDDNLYLDMFPMCVCAQSICQHMDPHWSIQSTGHQGSGVPQPDTQFPYLQLPGIF